MVFVQGEVVYLSNGATRHNVYCPEGVYGSNIYTSTANHVVDDAVSVPSSGLSHNWLLNTYICIIGLNLDSARNSHIQQHQVHSG